jgi:glycosyltransferase involved in cell wall biosynthesis
MQNIFFISSEKPQTYPVINANYTWYPIHNKLTFEEFSELWHKKQPYAIYSYGDMTPWNYLPRIFNVRKRWVQLKSLPKELDVISNVFSAMMGHEYDSDHPLISVITSTFHSKEKILRPWNSLKSQTYTNWEWVVWDDSKDNLTYGDLLEMKKKDLRMRVYKAPEPCGSIGEMKRLAAGVSYGSFIVELDHDDELHPELFQWIIDASKKYVEADFFYCNAAELFEGTLKSHSYGDFFAYGYGSNMNVWSEKFDKWITEIDNGPANPVTLRHLIGLPNHVRAWRTSFYDKIGKHNPRLIVSDDYDLLIRSYIHGKWCHIKKCGYYQYRNADGNFTFIRNSLIQHNVKYLYNYYKSQLPPIPDGHTFQPFWKSDHGQYPITHLTYHPSTHKYSIIMLDASKEKIENIMNIGISFHIYIVGPCPEIPVEWRKNVSWWCLGTEDREEKIRYIKRGIATGEVVVTEDEMYQIIQAKPKVSAKLSIITACCRPANLLKLKESICFEKIYMWYIVYDTSHNRSYDKQFVGESKITELECSEVGRAGHPLRNFVIKQIEDGLIYNLDDDNIMHPGFWDLLEKMDTEHFYTFDQVNNSRSGKDGILRGDTLKVRKIDTAQFVVPKNLVKTIEFQKNNYCADGEYMVEVNSKNPGCHVYFPKLAAYYNYISSNLT